MKDEIKEILDNMKEISSFEYTTDWFELNYEDTKILLDYITNLQEENEYSNHCNEELRKKITNLEYKIERLEEDNKELRIQISAREEEYIKLQDLCDKYEEEHRTTFEYWKQLVKEDLVEKVGDEE